MENQAKVLFKLVTMIFKPVVRWHVPGFLKLLLTAMSVCVCVCMHVCTCVSAPEAINYIKVIFNLYIKFSKFATFQNIRSCSIKNYDIRNETLG